MRPLNQILNDQTHGSTYLALQILGIIVQDNLNDTEIEDVLQRCIIQFSDMKIFSAIKNKIMDSNNKTETSGHLIRQIEESSLIITKKIKPLIKDDMDLITFSYSQTVQVVLSQLNYHKVYSMKSTPGNEGIVLAKNLKGSSIISDKEGIKKIYNNQIDCVIIGCDEYSNSNFINKIGTNAVLEATKTNQVPVYVLTSNLKYGKLLTLPKNSLFEICEITPNTEIITDF